MKRATLLLAAVLVNAPASPSSSTSRGRRPAVILRSTQLEHLRRQFRRRRVVHAGSRRHLELQGRSLHRRRLDYYKKSGDKVYTGGGQTDSSGFSTESRSCRPEPAAGDSCPGKLEPLRGRWHRYYMVDVSDGDADNSLGYHILAGAEFSRIAASAWRPSSNSHPCRRHWQRRTSLLYDEDNVGGIR